MEMLPVTYSIPSWHEKSQLSSGDDFNVAIIGAGNVNFGSDEGPWNHSYRLEQKLGPRLKVVALIDPVLERSADVLAKKRASFVKSAYESTQTYKSVAEFAAAAMTPEQKPRMILIGCPPAFRGSDQVGRDIELQLLKLFPGIAPLFPFFSSFVNDLTFYDQSTANLLLYPLAHTHTSPTHPHTSCQPAEPTPNHPESSAGNKFLLSMEVWNLMILRPTL